MSEGSDSAAKSGEDTTSEEGSDREGNDFDETFYYNSRSQGSANNFSIGDEGTNPTGETDGGAGGHITPSSSAGRLSDPAVRGSGGGGTRYRKRQTSNDRSSSPMGVPGVSTLFDASVFESTGYYMSSTSEGSGSKLDELLEEPDARPVGMVRIGSQHVSLNYLAALSGQDVSFNSASIASPGRRRDSR